MTHPGEVTGEKLMKLAAWAAWATHADHDFPGTDGAEIAAYLRAQADRLDAKGPSREWLAGAAKSEGLADLLAQAEQRAEHLNVLLHGAISLIEGPADPDPSVESLAHGSWLAQARRAITETRDERVNREAKEASDPPETRGEKKE